MMTLDEAIKHYEEVAEREQQKGYYANTEANQSTEYGTKCYECAEENRQLAEWLREVQKYSAILDELKDEITRAHNDLIESEYEYGENARYTENDRGYLGGLLHAYEMFGREYEEVNADDE